MEERDFAVQPARELRVGLYAFLRRWRAAMRDRAEVRHSDIVTSRVSRPSTTMEGGEGG